MKTNKNSNCAVVYVSKYGAAKKYAEIIAKALSADLYNDQEHPNDEILGQYSIIIWGGGIYKGKINGLNHLVSNLDKWGAKHLFSYSVGNTPIERLDILEKVRKNTVPKKWLQRITFFHFVARVNFSSLTFADRLLLSARRLSLLAKPKHALSSGERQFLAEYGKDMQVIDESSTEALINIVRRLDKTT